MSLSSEDRKHPMVHVSLLTNMLSYFSLFYEMPLTVLYTGTQHFCFKFIVNYFAQPTIRCLCMSYGCAVLILFL